jgi:hypothetical protein
MERAYAADDILADDVYDPRRRLPTPHMSLETLNALLDKMFPPPKGVKP